MRNRVKIVDTKFYVDSKNGVVTCVLKCDMQMDKHHKIWKGVSAEVWKKKFPSVDWYGGFTVKAKAKCNYSDTFDEVKGKRIAESRAKVKMYKVAHRVWTMCEDYFNECANTCHDLSIACYNATRNEEYHVDELTI